MPASALALLLLTATAAASPGASLHFPSAAKIELVEPGTRLRWRPWLVRIEASGPVRVDRVVFSWAVDDGPRYQARLMAEVAPGVFEFPLPGAETGGRSLRFFFVAWDESGNASVELGSPESPIALAIEADGGARSLAAAGVVASVVAVIVALGVLQESSRRRRALDRLFWFVTLRPLVLSTEPEREQRLRELGEVALRHPVAGLRKYPLATLRRQLGKVARQQAERLAGNDLLTYRLLLHEQARSQA